MSSLPTDALSLLQLAAAPPRLVVHLELVHDVAVRLLTGLRKRWPALDIDAHAVAFGAATHDLGKALVPGELSGPGALHEALGRRWLEDHGVSPALARFAETHAWTPGAPLPLEDLLVALADRCWRGARVPSLEDAAVLALAARAGVDRWTAFEALDGLVERIAAGADARLERLRLAPLR